MNREKLVEAIQLLRHLRDFYLAKVPWPHPRRMDAPVQVTQEALAAAAGGLLGAQVESADQIIAALMEGALGSLAKSDPDELLLIALDLLQDEHPRSAEVAQSVFRVLQAQPKLLAEAKVAGPWRREGGISRRDALFGLVGFVNDQKFVAVNSRPWWELGPLGIKSAHELGVPVRSGQCYNLAAAEAELDACLRDLGWVLLEQPPPEAVGPSRQTRASRGPRHRWGPANNLVSLCVRCGKARWQWGRGWARGLGPNARYADTEAEARTLLETENGYGGAPSPGPCVGDTA